jgi:hypothetical protein
MAGRKVFQPATVLTAADVNDFLMDQSVMVFADSAARGSAIAAPTEGMVTYLEDTNALEFFNGASYQPVSNPGDITSVTAGTGLTGGGTEGDVTLDVDLSAITPVTTQGDLVIGDVSGDEARLPIGTTGQILQSDGTTLSYVTPDSSPDDLITTQGDLIIGDASANAARIGIGAVDTVLTSNGTTATWEPISAGGLTLIASGTISGSGSITSIPGTFNHLMLVCSKIGNLAFSSSTIFLRVNNDTGTEYDYQGLNDLSPVGGIDTYFPITYSPGNASDRFGSSVTYFHNYTQSIAFSKLITHSCVHRNSGASGVNRWLANGMYRSTGALTSIQFTSSSTGVSLDYELYGVN